MASDLKSSLQIDMNFKYAVDTNVLMQNISAYEKQLMVWVKIKLIKQQIVHLFYPLHRF